MLKTLQLFRLMFFTVAVLLRLPGKSLKEQKEEGAKPYWQQLFQSLKDIVPQDYLVIVSADRGLYADWLYTEIVALGWHPFLRINIAPQIQL